MEKKQSELFVLGSQMGVERGSEMLGLITRLQTPAMSPLRREKIQKYSQDVFNLFVIFSRLMRKTLCSAWKVLKKNHLYYPQLPQKERSINDNSFTPSRKKKKKERSASLNNAHKNQRIKFLQDVLGKMKNTQQSDLIFLPTTQEQSSAHLKRQFDIQYSEQPNKELSDLRRERVYPQTQTNSSVEKLPYFGVPQRKSMQQESTVRKVYSQPKIEFHYQNKPALQLEYVSPNRPSLQYGIFPKQSKQPSYQEFSTAQFATIITDSTKKYSHQEAGNTVNKFELQDQNSKKSTKKIKVLSKLRNHNKENIHIGQERKKRALLKK